MKVFRFMFLVLSFLNVPSQAKELTVGVVLRFKHKFDTTVQHYNEGIETAKTLFEAENPGTQIILRSFPHDESLQSVAESAKRVIENHVPAVIGPEWSTETVVLADKLGPEKVVTVTPTATLPELTTNRPYLFRVCFSDEQVADSLARFVVTKLHPKVLGIFKNVSVPYSNYLATEFTKKIIEHSKSLNLPPPSFVEKEIISGTSNFSDLVASFKEKKVTFLASFVMDSEFSELISSGGRQNFFPTYIGSDSWGTNEYVHKRYVKESPYGAKFSAYRNYYWKEDSDSSMIRIFKKAFKRKYRNPPNAFNAIGFDAAWTLFTAMNKAKNPNEGDSIRAELSNIRNLELVTTRNLSFGSNNSPKKDLFIYKLDKNGAHYEATLK